MIADIENGMIALIGENSSLGYKLKELKTYGGEFADALDRAVKNFPCVLFLYQGGPISEVGQEFRIKARWLVIIGASNLRNEESARQGDTASGKVGAYQITMDVIKMLKRQTLGLEIDPIIPTNVRPLLNDKAGQQLASVYGIDLETSFLTEDMPDIGTIDDFITAHANWDIPPHGNVSTELPADATADATDHITLEQ